MDFARGLWKNIAQKNRVAFVEGAQIRRHLLKLPVPPQFSTRSPAGPGQLPAPGPRSSR